MQFDAKDEVLTTQEAISFLRISKPTFIKYVRSRQIRAVKAGNGYRILRSELFRFLTTPNATMKTEKPKEKKEMEAFQALGDDV
jgi:excisionase family DNA binding protein